MEEKRYQINFVGQDYSPIEKAYDNATVDGKEIELWDVDNKIFIDDKGKFDKDKVKKLLMEFLIKNQGEVKTLIINKNDDVTKNVKLYDPSFNENLFGGIVGVLTGQLVYEGVAFDVKLQIQSRFDSELGEESPKKAKLAKPFFLTTMLLGAQVKLSDNMIPSSEDEMFDYLLLLWFIERLQEANLKGFYRTYRRFEKNDERLKGSIDIARHIRLNAGLDNGKVAYSYRENTLNNPLNQLIIFAYEYIKKKYIEFVQENFDNIPDLKAIMMQLKQEVDMEGVNLFSVVSKNLKPISHPYYTEYEELRLICLRILRNEGISIFDAENNAEKTKSILFYLPDLWEKYLENKFIENKMSVKTQEEVYIWGPKFKQKTRPDFIFYNDEKQYMILDAKFKRAWGDAIEKGTLSDILNDYDKAIRDAVDINALATGVIFPVNSCDMKESCGHQLSIVNKLYRFYTFPVCVPYSKEEKYNEWKEKFDKNLQGVMTEMRDSAKKEYDFYQEYIKCIEELIKKRK